MDDVAELHLSAQERVERAISQLPALTKDDVPCEDSCPVCLVSFDEILEERIPDGTDPPPADELPVNSGVTKLEGCGHIFCKACLVEWIRGRHGSCPSCRHEFSSIKPPSDSDYESSDGDYVPDDEGSDDDDIDDGFFDSDGMMETDSAFDDFDLDMDVEEGSVDVDLDEDVDVEADDDGAVEVGTDNWGLSDGDGSESLSEGELGLSADMGYRISQANDAAVYTCERSESAEVLHLPEEPEEK